MRHAWPRHPLRKKSNANAAGLDFEAQLWAAADKLRDQRKNPKQDLADPPFNMSDWGGENLRQVVRDFSLSASIREVGVRCRVRSSPVNNAKYAWIQHFIHHLSPVGVAGFVMANSARIAHSCPIKIMEDVRKYATEQSIAEEEAFKKGMEEKSKEFVRKGAEVYSQS